jgi:hypothetical protein
MEDLLTLPNTVLSIVSFALFWLARQYLVPLLAVEKNRRYALWIAHLADEITDDLAARYPDSQLLEFLDEAVDKLMELCGIDGVTAERALSAAIKRRETAA